MDKQLQLLVTVATITPWGAQGKDSSPQEAWAKQDSFLLLPSSCLASGSLVFLSSLSVTWRVLELFLNTVMSFVSSVH